MNNNIFSMLLSSGDPQALLMNILQRQSGSNPILGNLLQMAQSNNSQGIENLARNLCRERGINADEMFRNVSSKVRGK